MSFFGTFASHFLCLRSALCGIVQHVFQERLIRFKHP